MLTIKHLTYVYNQGTPYEKCAVNDIDFEIKEGEFVGIIGCTGSGKSTLIQHFNGLLKPTSGTILYKDEDIFQKGYSKKRLRGEIGLVFQYPEYQLFSPTVLEDVAFGPKNIGFTEDESVEKAKNALKLVGIGEEMYEKTPFALSGGEKRRVAIAGILAMEPKVLVLDEPTAGLDPKGRNEILQLLSKLNTEENMTIVLVSHDMDAMSIYAKKLVILGEGQVKCIGTPKEVFSQSETIEGMGLLAPQAVILADKLRKMGITISDGVITPYEVVQEILKKVK